MAFPVSDLGTDYKSHLHRAERAAVVPSLKKLNGENWAMEIVGNMMSSYQAKGIYSLVLSKSNDETKARGKKNIAQASPN